MQINVGLDPAAGSNKGRNHRLGDNCLLATGSSHSRCASETSPAKFLALTVCTKFSSLLRDQSVSCFRFNARSGVS